MCGIVAVTGTEPALPVLLEGLRRLEYRGYDSAGIALQAGDRLWRRRRVGTLAVLTGAVGDAPLEATTGVGHTRWATHGAPTVANAHPHADCTGRVAVVHNGIVENHRRLRARLEAHGHRLVSETDTEVLAHLVEEGLAGGMTLAAAVRAMLAHAEGSLAVAVVSSAEPGVVVAARRGSPLVVGRTLSTGLVASDVPALLPYTSEVYALDDGQVVEVRPGAVRVVTPAGSQLRPERRGAGWDAAAVERAGYPDYMLKEIHEQPAAVAATLGGRRRDDAASPAEALGLSYAELDGVRRLLVVGCGTSLHAGLAARPALEAWARLPVECETASELRYREPLIGPSTLVVAVSQSGETVDTLYAVREARHHGARVVAVTNVASSAMAREADAVVLTQAGPEIGVAATKTHVAQLVALQHLAAGLAEARGTMGPADVADVRQALDALPGAIRQVLARAGDVFDVARRHADAHDVFFLGRGAGHAVAMEGALKLKEIAYVRAEAYAAGEMKHGPIALVEPGVTVVAVVGTGVLRTKMLSNMAEMRARAATVVAVAYDGDREAADAADGVLWVPRPPRGVHVLSPAVEVVPLQLFAYAVAKARGLDVDKPRNLAKTVTVE